MTLLFPVKDTDIKNINEILKREYEVKNMGQINNHLEINNHKEDQRKGTQISIKEKTSK